MAGDRHLLWILSLCASLVLSGSRTLDGVAVYEVIRPVRLHSLYKRDVESSRPDVVKYAMTLHGKHIEMELQKNKDLLTKDYTETYYTKEGTPVTTKPEALDLCYYQGKIVNDSGSLVSMSTCDGLRGYFQTAEQRFLIEPLSEDGDHAVLKYEDVNNTPMVCGVTNTSWDTNTDGFPPHTGKSRSRFSGSTSLQQQKYNELFLVADNRMYVKMDKDIDKVRKRMYEIVNFVNTVYKEISTFIAVVGLEVWTDSDKINVTTPAGETLDKFTKWRNDDLLKRQQHDNAHLITAIDFDGSTVGLAFIGTLCSGHSTGVIQDHNPRAVAVGATLSHEMGHNLGMNHDTSSCTCTDNSCIMAAALSYTIPQHFSSCSVNSFEQYLNSRNPECLLNKPEDTKLLQPPVCGNGFKEIGEQCDCGTATECPCCNATTCMLKMGSECAEGECCRECKILDSSYMCREKHDECDLAEYCSGQSGVCPEDVFAVNGLPCKNKMGYCYNGSCPLRKDECIKMWGADAVVASNHCYEQNKRGLFYGFCSRPSSEQFIGCQTEDILCGKLFCSKGQENPINSNGRLARIGDCKTTFFDNISKDNSLVETGTKCDNDKVCSKNQCVDLETAYKATNCSAKCQGHGVCNHKLECTCEPGWLPPDCERRSTSGLSRSGVIAVVVVTFILLGIVLALVAIYLMKRRKRQCQTSRQMRKKEPAPISKSYFSPQRVTPPMLVHPKGPPPHPPKGSPKVPTTAPPKVPPTAPPKVPPTAPPKVPPTAPPKVPPTALPKSLHTDFRAAKQALRPPPPAPKV
ncbi:disintegrin and metalloproteinase domain-containing protein 28 [Electrophorus electricus]|uniref:ADAM metallopeptidase domain 28 n=1 Tax=Electrophorus electricus TaxID=8005 RepID=A0A4W4HIB5_ELEEL|nr:disintegrin and metalloproteinase domain-containing protein 28 [Electrophorus electricus]